MNLRTRASHFVRRLVAVLEPPAPTPVEPKFSDRDREALARMGSELEARGRRQGTAPLLRRQRSEVGEGDLRYLVDCYGERGAAERLMRAAAEREGAK